MPQDSITTTKAKKIKSNRKINRERCEQTTSKLVDMFLEELDIPIEEYTDQELIEELKKVKESIKVIE